MDGSSPGQKLLASLVDIAFFVVLGLMGWHGVLKEGAVLMLLGLYAQGRFNVAMQKQQTVQMATITGSSGPTSGPGGGGGSGRYQQNFMPPVTAERAPDTMPGVRPPPAPTPQEPPRVPRPDPRREHRSITRILRGYIERPAHVVLAVALVVVLLRIGSIP